MTSKKLLSLLNDYGLSNNESRVYIGLLKYGHSTVMELSNRIRMNRSTTHLAVNELISKGLVSQTKYGERRILIPESPEKIQLLVESEKLNIKRKEEGLSVLIDSIYEQIHSAKTSTEFVVKYIEGRESVSVLYDSILESKEIRAYYNFKALTTMFPENGEKFLQAGLKGVKVWDIIADGDSGSLMWNHKMYSQTENVKFKLLPERIDMGFMDYLIYENRIAMVYFEDVPKAILISNPLLSANAKALFDLMWGFLD